MRENENNDYSLQHHCIHRFTMLVYKSIIGCLQQVNDGLTSDVSALQQSLNNLLILHEVHASKHCVCKLSAMFNRYFTVYVQYAEESNAKTSN